MLKKNADGQEEEEALLKERHRELKAQLDDAIKMGKQVIAVKALVIS